MYNVVRRDRFTKFRARRAAADDRAAPAEVRGRHRRDDRTATPGARTRGAITFNCITARGYDARLFPRLESGRLRRRRRGPRRFIIVASQPHTARFHPERDRLRAIGKLNAPVGAPLGAGVALYDFGQNASVHTPARERSTRFDRATTHVPRYAYDRARSIVRRVTGIA